MAKQVTPREAITLDSGLPADREVRYDASADPLAGDELRDLLQAWREAKASVWRAALAWLVRGTLALVLIGIAVRLNVTEMLR